MGEAIVWVLAAGGGLLFSATRDGGAVGLHVYAGDQRASEFSTSPEDWGALLEDLRSVLEELGIREVRRDVNVPESRP